MVITLPGQVIVGGVVSLTVIVCVQLLEFPQTSVAVYVRRIVNRLAQVMLFVTSPDHATVTGLLQAPLALPPAKFAAGTWLAHWTVTPAGQLIVGGVVFVTVIVCVQLLLLLHTSVAVQVRVIV